MNQRPGRAGDPMAGRLSLDKARGASNRPKYVGPPPPANRFNLMPGHTWDGVDRSKRRDVNFGDLAENQGNSNYGTRALDAVLEQCGRGVPRPRRA